MKKEKWSDYAKYLVLSDKSNYKLGCSFPRYLNFKKIKEVLNSIAFTDKSTFTVNGEILTRKITSNDAKTILKNIDECNWTTTTNLIKGRPAEKKQIKVLVVERRKKA